MAIIIPYSLPRVAPSVPSMLVVGMKVRLPSFRILATNRNTCNTTTRYTPVASGYFTNRNTCNTATRYSSASEKFILIRTPEAPSPVTLLSASGCSPLVKTPAAPPLVILPNRQKTCYYLEHLQHHYSLYSCSFSMLASDQKLATQSLIILLQDC